MSRDRIFPILDRPTLIYSDRPVEPKLKPRSDFEESIFKYIRDEDREWWYTWPRETQRYFLPSTATPHYYQMRKKPEYYRDAKGETYELLLMKPERYKELVIKGFMRTPRVNTEEQAWAIYEPKMEKIEDIISKGERLPMMFLNYKRGFSQEGRHRTEAMIRRNVGKIPVMVVWGVDDEPPIREVR